jgi:hypothetical protein
MIYDEATMQFIETDGKGVEVRRYSTAELMCGSPESNGVLASLIMQGNRFDVRPKEKKAEVGVNEPVYEKLRDKTTNEEYIFMMVTHDGVAIGRDRYGTEYALPPYGWERFGGRTQPPRAGFRPTPPSSGETILR